MTKKQQVQSRQEIKKPIWIKWRFWTIIVFVSLLSLTVAIKWFSVERITPEKKGVALEATSENLPKREIKASDKVWEFNRNNKELPESYKYEEESYSVKKILQETITMGLIVVRRNEILHESYYFDYDKDYKLNARSATGSILSALFGIALKQRKIKSINDPIIKYIPELTESDYKDVSIRNVLEMSAGTQFSFSKDKKVDFFKLIPKTFEENKMLIDYFLETESLRNPGEYVSPYGPPPGIVLGVLLEKVTGERISYYMESELWQPMGAESDAFWSIDGSGREISFGFFHATLRDYARIGRLFLENGRKDGETIIPENWIAESTKPQGLEIITLPNNNYYNQFYYGLHWFIPKNRTTEEFLAIVGNGGHYIYINPDDEIVIVKTGTDHNYQENYNKNIELLRVISEYYSKV
jgi:CubicO group peptidase (beta-lactamase class C family)